MMRSLRLPSLVVPLLLVVGLSCSESSSSSSADDVPPDLARPRPEAPADLPSWPGTELVPEVVPGIPSTPIPEDEEERRERDLRRFRQPFGVAEPQQPGSSEPPYRVVGLGSGRCTSISPDGLLVAGTTDRDGLRAFVVGANGVRRELSPPEGFSILASSRRFGVGVPRAIQGGVVVGFGGRQLDADVPVPELAPTRALLHGAEGWDIFLPDEVAVVHAANAQGVLVGMRSTRMLSTREQGGLAAFRHDEDGLLELPSLGGAYAMATDINAKGEIVGVSTLPKVQTEKGLRTPGSHAVMWIDARPVDLGTLGGTFSLALAVNNSGAVVGYSELEEGVPIRHAFLYRHGALSDIDPGYPRGSRAHDINERGDIAGSFHDELGVDQPFVVSGGATHVLRPNLGKGLAFAGGRAESVGEGGEVIGWSVHPDGGSECLVWVPTGCRRCPFATWLDGASPAETGGAL